MLMPSGQMNLRGTLGAGACRLAVVATGISPTVHISAPISRNVVVSGAVSMLYSKVSR